ncbi:MAG: PIN domain-containing protein [Candidatus Bathyarchaeia archaeon]
MKTTLVLDVGALSLFFAGDPRIVPYFNRIDQDQATGLITEINLAEYYYKTCQKIGKQAADTRYFLLRNSKLKTIGDESLSRLAGVEKCKQELDLSLADCFALALAKREHATLITTDRELGKAKDVPAKLFRVQ